MVILIPGVERIHNVWRFSLISLALYDSLSDIFNMHLIEDLFDLFDAFVERKYQNQIKADAPVNILSQLFEVLKLTVLK